MSDDIKELVQKTIAEVGRLQARLVVENQQLRDENKCLRELVEVMADELINPDGPEAALALEALAGEVERLRGLLKHAELDCHKARFALQTIGGSHVPDQPASSGLTELEHVQHHHKQLRHLAIMALRPEAVGIYKARPPLPMRASLQDEYRATIVGEVMEEELKEAGAVSWRTPDDKAVDADLQREDAHERKRLEREYPWKE